MVATSIKSDTLPASFEFRLRFAHRMVEEMRRQRKFEWTQEDLGVLLLETLEEDFEFNWSQPNAAERFQEYLALAHVAASTVLPASRMTVRETSVCAH